MAMADPRAWNPNYGVVGSGDRRLAYSRQPSFSSPRPGLARSDSSISMPVPLPQPPKADVRYRWLATRPMRRLALLLALNAAYSAVELAVGLLTGRVGLVSDAFHLTFGCGLLSFSLFAMAASRTKPDSTYTYGSVCTALLLCLVDIDSEFQVHFSSVGFIRAPGFALLSYPILQVQEIGGPRRLHECRKRRSPPL